ncbi:DUF2194 domain-containing protein [Ruminococcus sp. 5_1_39BFAA]|uniref:DUF2194 domain-containing protein n=1 Tax=Ruminococcus sp. 5_1_39BFAA TaxID=457412 RepID=UPI0035633F52
MKKQKKKRYLPVLAVFGVFVLLSIALLGRNNWVMSEKIERKIQIADADAFSVEDTETETEQGQDAGQKEECLYLWDSGDPNSEILHEQMPQILHDMKIPFKEVDVQTEALPDWNDFEKVVLGLTEYTTLGNQILELTDWVSEGGSVLIAMIPAMDMEASWLMQRAGAEYIGSSLYQTPGLRLVDERLLHGDLDEYMLEEPFESSLSVALEPDCQVHMVSADDNQVPLLWERKVDDGRIVVVNLGIYDKAYRGFYSAAYSMLGDVCAWPVINAATFYLDDFPSPVPSGESSYINADYNMDIKTFYMQIWWKDICELAEKYGIRYTGMVIEEYSDQVEGPFTSTSGVTLFQYFGNTLLGNGGEIGFHGYNHMPLCLSGFDYMGQFDSYYPFESYGDMRDSVAELASFCKRLFPKEEFQVYVPPSNILSEEGRSMLISEFPQIKAIASTYLPGNVAYDQEFEVSEEGIIETPRTISGYLLDEYERMTATSELNLHFVSSHFQHPDDVLDVDRGAELGWETLFGRLSDYVDWVYEAAPGIRSLTGSETAGAVQRFYYVEPERKETEEGLEISLKRFSDEAWLMVRFNDWEPQEEIEGGELTHLQDNLYLLHAEDSKVVIKKKV